MPRECLFVSSNPSLAAIQNRPPTNSHNVKSSTAKRLVVNNGDATYTVVCDDSRTALAEFKGQTDLIVTSPPYADARHQHYDSVRPDQFTEWFLTFHRPLWDALKPNGSFVLNIKDKVVNGVRHRYVWRTIEALCASGWNAIDDYIWHKPNPVPGRWPARLSDGWEYCFHLCKTKRPHFDHEAVKRPIAASTAKRVVRMSKHDIGHHYSASGSGFGRDLSKWIGKTKVLPPNVLTLATVGHNVGHPAAFPTKLPAFFIKLLCPQNGLVIDPFGGSGTTGIAALQLTRHCVLIDNKPEYFDVAVGRLQKVGIVIPPDAVHSTCIPSSIQRPPKVVEPPQLSPVSV